MEHNNNYCLFEYCGLDCNCSSCRTLRGEVVLPETNELAKYQYLKTVENSVLKTAIKLILAESFPLWHDKNAELTEKIFGSIKKIFDSGRLDIISYNGEIKNEAGKLWAYVPANFEYTSGQDIVNQPGFPLSKTVIINDEFYYVRSVVCPYAIKIGDTVHLLISRLNY